MKGDFDTSTVFSEFYVFSEFLEEKTLNGDLTALQPEHKGSQGPVEADKPESPIKSCRIVFKNPPQDLKLPKLSSNNQGTFLDTDSFYPEVDIVHSKVGDNLMIDLYADLPCHEYIVKYRNEKNFKRLIISGEKKKEYNDIIDNIEQDNTVINRS